MKQNNTLSILISFLIGLFVFFVGIDVESQGEPNKIYKVYLNGETIGLIHSEEELVNLIDEKQEEIKRKYNVEKVYPPTGLEIKEEFTYSTDISTPEEIYDYIQDKEPFTINGYTITIKYPSEEDSEEIKETVFLKVLNEDHFKEAFKNVIKSFVGSKEYDQYDNSNQPEIVDTGSKIETIYWEETITLKEDLISVDTDIFTSEDDISKYLLFGTLDEQEHYTIKDGDDIATITYSNNLSTEEFLVANPQFTSENVLLTPGQIVNIGLIKPVVTIVAEMHVVEDIVNKYKTEYIDDKDSYVGTESVKQEGSDGLTRVTEKVLYKNGEINNLVIASSTEITQTVNKIVSRGIKGYYSGGYEYFGSGGNENWSWPTLSPFVITSRFKYRWGTHHDGIDISGTGHGSPIYAVNDGVVIVNKYVHDFGYYTVIDHQNGYLTLYAHFAQMGRHSVGTNVKREQVIGYMGNTGRSTGTHLHFSVIKDTEFNYTNYLDPCNSIFKC